MPGKPARRRAAGTRPKVEPAADSAIARVVDRAFDNPAMSGGLMVMAITAMAIVSNALFLQAGHHPEPLFATRPAATASAPVRPAVTVPLPHTREQAAAKGESLSQVIAAAEPAAAPAAPAAPDPNKVLVMAVQRELARLGVYTGSIDGLYGPRTKAAISTWQTAAGIAVTGEPSPELLAAMRKPVASAPPAPPPVPAAVKQAASTDEVAAAVKRAAELEREQAALAMGKQLHRVQEALNRIGYGPVATDGRLDPSTKEAIRGFQLDNGLPPTGELDGKLMARLVSIGAMKAE